MNIDYFRTRREKLENVCGKKYTKSQREIMERDIYHGLKPTAMEWDQAVEFYINEGKYPHPSLNELKQYLRENRTVHVTRSVPCTTCDGAGILFIRKDSPVVLEDIAKQGTSRHIGVVGCGCDNTPAWHKEEYFYVGPPEARKPAGRRNPTATLSEYLKANKTLSRADFARQDGRWLDESDEHYRERRLSEVAFIEADPGSVRCQRAIDVIVKNVSKSMG